MQGNHHEAIAVWKSILTAVDERPCARTDGEHRQELLDAAKIYNTIAIAYAELGETCLSMEYLEKTLRVREEVLGSEHLEVAKVLISMGHGERKRQSPHKASEYFQRALAIKEARLGESHMEVASVLNYCALTIR